MSIVIVTDGSADNKTGSGGWASIIRDQSQIVEITGWASATTSNRMELTAAIKGLKEIAIPSDIVLISDSAYVLNCLQNKWYEGWMLEEDPRPNMDLWLQLIGLIHFHKVQLVKVKGHSGEFWNERADKLAKFSRIEQKELRNIMPNVRELYDRTTA